MNPQSLQFLGAVRQLENQGYSRDEAYQMVMRGTGANTPSTSVGLFDDINVDPISMNTPNQRNSNTFGFDMTSGMTPVTGNPMGLDWTTPINSNMPQAPQNTVPNTTMSTYQNANNTVKTGAKKMTDFSTEEEWVRYSLENELSSPDTARMNWQDWKGVGSGGKENQQGYFTPEQQMELMRMRANKDKMDSFAGMMGAGTDIGTNAFLLGNAWAKDKGTKGRGLAIGAGIGKVGLGLAGDFLSGFAQSKMTERSDKWMRDDLYGPDANLYTAAPQTRNTNNTGGSASGQYGGLFEDGGFQEEGEMPETPMEEGVEEGVEQVQEPQEEQQGMMQQVAAQVAQALNQGTSPQMIIQSLVKKGMSEQQATQLVSMVVQKMQDENKSAEEETEDSGEAPEMRKGGTFKHKVGDYIKFEYGGKMREGKIKKIENGKIYL